MTSSLLTSGRSWHALPLTQIYAELRTNEGGLTAADVQVRQREFGPNRLPHKPPPTLLQIMLRQFRSPLIYILGIAAAISLFIDEPTDAAFILAVLLLNAVIGGYQEWRAEQSAQALQQLLRIRATVVRSGEVTEINAEDIVPGDMVWLESGNRVPADVRLVTSQGLEIDESLLTGESLAVVKDATWSGPAHVALGDRLNMGFAGSIVARGRAKAVVVATGGRTQVGQLAKTVVETEGGEPPLLVRMARFTRVIAAVVVAASILVALIGILLRGQSATEMFLFAVALAVSAIPEGLPVAMTVALAIATNRMARRGVIVRKLTAVEGLGSCTLIATDKTGTLTVNALTVKRVELPDGASFEVTGEGFVPEGVVLQDGRTLDVARHPEIDRLARAAVLCNEADLHQRDGEWVWRGDAVDLAFLAFAHKLGWSREAALSRSPYLNQIPFEPERQYAASFHVIDGEPHVFVKGAPERILPMCAAPGSSPADLLRVGETMARQGYRVLAVADGAAPGVNARTAPPEPANLELLGFVGMIDPLRPGVREAVRSCQEAGVGVCMVTGDHRVTALAIARDLGLAYAEADVVTGPELARLSDEALAGVVTRARVFARVSPQQKLQIVNAARQAGHFVAVTGDGVNDAPALRAANIGVAMGRGGTDVAREASELVISDDNFATIVAGIDEGRIAYDNIRKVIYLLVSTGAAELVLVALAVITGMPLPLLPVQLLWLNLVTNGIQDVALAFEPGEGDTLRRQPLSPRERIFNRLMIERTLAAALVMGTVGFLMFWAALRSDVAEDSARNLLLLLMVLFENVHVGNCRSEIKSAFVLSPLRSPILLTGTVIAFSIHLAAVYSPLGHQVLRTEPVSLSQWALLSGLALTILAALELHKLSWRRRFGSRRVTVRHAP